MENTKKKSKLGLLFLIVPAGLIIAGVIVMMNAGGLMVGEGMNRSINTDFILGFVLIGLAMPMIGVCLMMVLPKAVMRRTMPMQKEIMRELGASMSKTVDIETELKKLDDMKNRRLITEEEYKASRAKLLGTDSK